MKFTHSIATAILAFVAVPLRAVPLTPANLNQTGVTIEDLGPISVSVAPEGIIVPGVTDMQPTGISSDRSFDNLEKFPFAADDFDGLSNKIATPVARSDGADSRIKKILHGLSWCHWSGPHKFTTFKTHRPCCPILLWHHCGHGPVVHTGNQNATVENVTENSSSSDMSRHRPRRIRRHSIPGIETEVDGSETHNEHIASMGKPHRYGDGTPNFHPWGMLGGHGPVVTGDRGHHSSIDRLDTGMANKASEFRTITFAPKPASTPSNHTGGIGEVLFHREESIDASDRSGDKPTANPAYTDTGSN